MSRVFQSEALSTTERMVQLQSIVDNLLLENDKMKARDLRLRKKVRAYRQQLKGTNRTARLYKLEMRELARQVTELRDRCNSQEARLDDYRDNLRRCQQAL